MTLPALDVQSSPQSTVVTSEERLERLQQDYAELNTAIFEAAQVHRRLCAPSLVRYGSFDVASEIFAVRHLPGDFVSVEDTRDGLVLALGDIGGKGDEEVHVDATMGVFEGAGEAVQDAA